MHVIFFDEFLWHFHPANSMNPSEENTEEGSDESCNKRNVGERAEANVGEVADESCTEKQERQERGAGKVGEAGEGADAPEVEGTG